MTFLKVTFSFSHQHLKDYVTNFHLKMYLLKVVVYMVRELGYGGRRAHRICATLVRIARDRGIKAPELTGQMLDEAAKLCEEQPPNLSTSVLQKCLDPVEFIRTHKNTGGPAPSETERMVRIRQKVIADARARQEGRLNRITQGEQLLKDEIATIQGNQD